MKGGLKCDRMSWENLDFKLLQGGGSWTEGSEHPDSHTPIKWLLPLFYFHCKSLCNFAKKFNPVPAPLASSTPPIPYSHEFPSPCPHQITLRYWELLLKLGKKVFIHKSVTNMLYPKCSGFLLLLLLLLTVQGYELFRTGPSKFYRQLQFHNIYHRLKLLPLVL